MQVIDHGTFLPYSPENPELFGGRAAIYLKNEAGQDWYELVAEVTPGATLVEAWPDSGIVLGSAADADYSAIFPAGRRVLEVRPARTDLKGMRWDGADFVTIPPPVLTRLAKADLWRRLTDEEAEALDAALQAAPLRLRRVFDAAQYLDTTDADYPALRAGIVSALGEERADEVLAPTY